MAQATKFTPKTRAKILEGVRAGLSLGSAFKRARVDATTGFRWLSLGHVGGEGNEEFEKFVLDLHEAEADFELEMLEEAKKGTANPSWAARMTVLERRFPDRYGKRDTTVIEGGDRPVQVRTHAVLEDARTRQLAASLLRQLAAGSAELASGVRVDRELAAGDVIEGDGSEQV